MRLIVLSITLLAMTIIVGTFYQADAISSRSSVLPSYILFFILIYLACLMVEYLSLWCERDQNFHCCRMAVHSLALVLVTYEVSVFYAADQHIYSQLPSYSVTSLLSNLDIDSIEPVIH